MPRQAGSGRDKVRVRRAEALGLALVALLILLFVVLRGNINWSAR
jgi:hypothetical protein